MRLHGHAGLLLIAGPLLLSQGGTSAQEHSQSVRLVRVIDAGEPGGQTLRGRGLELESWDPLNTTFDDKGRRWLALVGSEPRWVEIATRGDGSLDPDTIRRSFAHDLNLEQARGLTVDPESGSIYVLDGAQGRIVRVEPPGDGSLEAAYVSEFAAAVVRHEGLRGLAFDASSGHLHVWSASEQRLYELSLGGRSSRIVTFPFWR